MKEFYKKVLEAAFEEIKKHPEKTDDILESVIRMFEHKPELKPYQSYEPYQPYQPYQPLPIDPYFVPLDPYNPTITISGTNSAGSYKVYNE